MQKHLQISVVMPSFNQGAYIEKSITSLLNQQYPNLELIVMDAGSVDQTREILERHDSHIDYWRSHPDKGQSAAINEGMDRSHGEILCWLNSDDCHTGETLWIVDKHFRDNPTCQWLIGAGQFINQSGAPMWHQQVPDHVSSETMTNWYQGGMFHQPSVFWRRSIWKTAGGLREDFDLAMDFELWLRFLKIAPPYLTNELLSVATDHADMKTRSQYEQSYAEVCHAFFLNGFPNEGRQAVADIAARAFRFKRLSYALTKYGPVRRFLSRAYPFLPGSKR